MPHDVFISYSSQDKITADAVCARLEAYGIRCWIAPRDVLPGAQWAEAIMDAIEATRVMVVVCSASTNSSRQVVREVERAVDAGSIIIPFRIEDVPFTRALTFFLSSCHWLDALTPPLEKHIQHLAETVTLILRGAPPATVPEQPTGAEPRDVTEAPGDAVVVPHRADPGPAGGTLAPAPPFAAAFEPNTAPAPGFPGGALPEPSKEHPAPTPVQLAALAPHRGPMILLIALACPVCPLLSAAAGILAYFDLRAIKQGRMDPAGRGLTTAGLCVGAVGFAGWLMWLGFNLITLILNEATR